MKSSSVLKSVESVVKNKNFILLFLLVLVGFVLVDCNTKIFSKMLEGNSNINNNIVNGSNGRCGKGCDGKNPEGCAAGNCNTGAVNGLNNNNGNGGLPQGFVEDQKLYVSAQGPLGRDVPKTLQGDYSTLKSFGLTNLKDVVNYIPGDGPSQFVKGNRNNNNAAGVRNNNVNNNSNSSGKYTVYGSMSCGWTKKQLKYMDDNSIPYEYVDCVKDRDACPKEVTGFPTIRHCDGTLKSGFQEVNKC